MRTPKHRPLNDEAKLTEMNVIVRTTSRRAQEPRVAPYGDRGRGSRPKPGAAPTVSGCVATIARTPLSGSLAAARYVAKYAPTGAANFAEDGAEMARSKGAALGGLLGASGRWVGERVAAAGGAAAGALVGAAASIGVSACLGATEAAVDAAEAVALLGVSMLGVVASACGRRRAFDPWGWRVRRAASELLIDLTVDDEDPFPYQLELLANPAVPLSERRTNLSDLLFDRTREADQLAICDAIAGNSALVHYAAATIDIQRVLEHLANLSGHPVPEVARELALGDSDGDQRVLALAIAMNMHELLTVEDVSSVVAQLARAPKEPSALDKWFRLESIDFSDGGRSESPGGAIAQGALSMDPASPPPPSRLAAALHAHVERAEQQTPRPARRFFAALRDDEGWACSGMLGRTALFRRGETTRAVKMLKPGEPVRELWRQHAVVTALRAHCEELGLQSQIPTPVDVVHAGDARTTLGAWSPAAARALAESIGGDADGVAAYVYDVEDDGYFTYLHAAGDAAHFSNGALRGIHDLMALLRHGIAYPALADMFHNSEAGHQHRDDGGRYRPLQVLFAPWSGGAGRLSGWRSSIEYMNVRETGIADEGDYELLRDHLSSDGRASSRRPRQGFSFVERDLGMQIGLQNVVAEYTLVMELAAGRRAADSAGSEDPAVWREAADMLLQVHAHTLAAQTELPERVALQILQRSVDERRYARQMQFWMTPAYHAAIADGAIPPDIYGNDVTTTVAPSFRDGSFTREGGFQINRADGPDLGPVNGPYPMKEGEKLRVLVAFFSSLVRAASARGAAESKAAHAHVIAGDLDRALEGYERARALRPFDRSVQRRLMRLHEARATALAPTQPD